mmetsp:Transcript_18609/g.30361  ORF Transcript_18609/g.30361 Transcript_18609/m.30361 type:complete len:570 (+) Transcript_18609:255-1964(+)
MGFTGKIVSERGHYEEFVCAICCQLVDLDKSVLTQCSHVFCVDCLEEWNKRKNSCPICQQGYQEIPRSLKTCSPIAWRVLSKVRVRCPMSNCGAEFDYSELQPHLVSSGSHQTQNSRDVAVSLKQQANESFRSKNHKDAIRLYSKAIAMCGDMVELFGNRSLVFYTLGNYEHAFDDAKRATEIDPTYAKGWLRAINALIARGDFEKASRFVDTKAITSSNKSVRAALDRLRKCSNYYQNILNAISLREFQAAQQYSSWLLRETTAASVIAVAARIECEVGTLERAERLTIEALRQDPSNPQIFVTRGLVKLYRGDIEQSIKCVKEALRLDPDDEEAKRVFRSVREIRDSLDGARKHVYTKDFNLAISLFTAVLEINVLPLSSQLRAEVLAERGNAYFRRAKKGDYEASLEDCSSAISIHEELRRAWLTKAYVLHAQGKHDQALDVLTQVMETWGRQDSVVTGAYEKAQFLVRKAKRPDYYRILGITGSLASTTEIKAAYKRKALECHPDRVTDTAEKKQAEQEFKVVGEALEILTDSFKRKLYDEGYDKEAIEERVKRAMYSSNNPHHH